MAARSLRDMVARQQSISDPDAIYDEVRILRSSDRQVQPKRSTFVIEALLLFMCLMIVIAVSVSVIAFSSAEGARSSHKETGVIMATNIAELFSADPKSVEEVYEQGDYTARCAIDLSMDEAGSLYDATITVSWKDEEIYSLKTSKYVSHSDASSGQGVASGDGQVM